MVVAEAPPALTIGGAVVAEVAARVEGGARPAVSAVP